jgi:uncharacterized protein
MSHSSESSLSYDARRFVERSTPLISTSLLALWRTTIAYIDASMQQDSGHDWHHLWRVLRSAHHIALAEHLGTEQLDRVCLATLMHDLVNLPKDHPERHTASKRSADLATSFLSPHLPQRDLDIIHDAIWSHSFSAKRTPQHAEGRVLTDADRLDSLGAFGLMRTFAVGGLLQRPLLHPDDPFASQRPLDDSTYSLDHLSQKLLTLIDLMHTPTGRQLAQQRHDFILTFLDQLRHELDASMRSGEKDLRSSLLFIDTKTRRL